MTDSNPDQAARRELRRYRGLASGLLVLMGGLTLGTYAMPPGYWTAVLQAASKAGFVGGIADWFAVTALFRHPLGIPIPHTAIIPRQKERLGRALGRFVANNVFSTRQPSTGYQFRLANGSNATNQVIPISYAHNSRSNSNNGGVGPAGDQAEIT